MPNETISVPDDVVPIIESLDVPFSGCDPRRRPGGRSTAPGVDQLRTRVPGRAPVSVSSRRVISPLTSVAR